MEARSRRRRSSTRRGALAPWPWRAARDAAATRTAPWRPARAAATPPRAAEPLSANWFFHPRTEGLFHFHLAQESSRLMNLNGSANRIDEALHFYDTAGHVFTELVGSPYYVAPEQAVVRHEWIGDASEAAVEPVLGAWRQRVPMRGRMGSGRWKRGHVTLRCA
ncbi:hypothetical protein EJB05_38966, partial [Eragrostis curvula]